MGKEEPSTWNGMGGNQTNLIVDDAFVYNVIYHEQ